jgi:hypothetical protein
MAVDVTKVTTAGLEYALYGARDSSGYLIGSTATAPAAGSQTGNPMGILAKPKEFPFQPESPERVDITGGDGHVSTFQFKPITAPTGQPRFAENDMTFAALVQGLAVHDLGGGAFLMQQPDDFTYQDMLWVTVSRAESRESGSLGVSHWYGEIVLNTQVYYRGRDNRTERGDGSFLYDITLNSADRYPFGLAFSAGNNGATGGKIMEWTWPYRPVMERWTGNGVETSFNVTSTFDIAEDSADNALAYVNGTAQTWVTGAPLAGEFGITEGTPDIFVFGTAPPSDAKVVTWFGWQ